jgi:hypothetical protein
MCSRELFLCKRMLISCLGQLFPLIYRRSSALGWNGTTSTPFTLANLGQALLTQHLERYPSSISENFSDINEQWDTLVKYASVQMVGTRVISFVKFEQRCLSSVLKLTLFDVNINGIWNVLTNTFVNSIAKDKHRRSKITSTRLLSLKVRLIHSNQHP